LNQTSSSGRTAKSKADRSDGAFATLMESRVERRDDPKPARADRGQSRRTERHDPAPSEPAARSDAPAQSKEARAKEARAADRPTEQPAVEVKDGALPAEGSSSAEEKPGDGAAFVAAAFIPPVPVSQTVAAQDLPATSVATASVATPPVETPTTPAEIPSTPVAAAPAIPAPAVAIPATDVPQQQQQPAETAGPIAVPAAMAQVSDPAAAIPLQQSAMILAAKPQIAAKTEGAPADDVAANAESSTEAPQAELPEELLKQTKPPAVQTQPNASNKPGLTADPAFKPDDFLSAPKLTTEHTPQITPHMPLHVTAATTATPQANPVSTAQAVPVNAVAVEIAGQAKAGNTRFEIRLDPAELGRIDVRLDIDKDGNVSSRLVIERADTYDLLRRDQSALERALQQAGLKTSENALEFSLRDQGFGQQQKDDNPRGIRTAVAESDVIPSEAINGYARLLGGRSGVDIRV